MKYQCKAHRELGRKKQRIAVQGKPDMSVRSEFGEQEILDIATAAADLCDQFVGGRQRPDPLIDAGPDLRFILKDLMKNGVNCRQFVL